MQANSPSLVATGGPAIKFVASLVVTAAEPLKLMAGASVGLPGVAALPMPVFVLLTLQARILFDAASYLYKSDAPLLSGIRVRVCRLAAVQKYALSPSPLTRTPPPMGERKSTITS